MKKPINTEQLDKSMKAPVYDMSNSPMFKPAIAKSVSEVAKSDDDIVTNTQGEFSEVMRAIKSLDAIAVTSVRNSDDERDLVLDFIDELRKAKCKMEDVSMSRLYRYALTYMITKKRKEFKDILVENFKKREQKLKL